jgi:hypothetical protein
MSEAQSEVDRSAAALHMSLRSAGCLIINIAVRYCAKTP